MSMDIEVKSIWILTCDQCPDMKGEYRSAGGAEAAAREHLEAWTEPEGDLYWNHLLSIVEVTRVGRNLS